MDENEWEELAGVLNDTPEFMNIMKWIAIATAAATVTVAKAEDICLDRFMNRETNDKIVILRRYLVMNEIAERPIVSKPRLAHASCETTLSNAFDMP